MAGVEAESQDRDIIGVEEPRPRDVGGSQLRSHRGPAPAQYLRLRQLG